MIEIFTTPEGLTLSYERRGNGPLLVCHPGGPGGSAAEFEDFAGFLFHPVVYDDDAWRKVAAVPEAPAIPTATSAATTAKCARAIPVLL